jgi:hypothetical protein
LTFEHDGESIAIAMKQQAEFSWLVVVQPSRWSRTMFAMATSPEDCAQQALDRLSSALLRCGRPPLTAGDKARLLARLIEEHIPTLH